MLQRIKPLLVSGLLSVLITACSSEEDPKANEVEEQQPSTQTEESISTPTDSTPQDNEPNIEQTITYRNDDHGFTLRMPQTWKGLYVVEPEESESETSIHFSYHQEDVPLFSVVVLPITKEEWDDQYAGGLWEYVGSRENEVFAISVPTNIPSGFDENKKDRVRMIDEVSRMINSDVPRIIKSFQLNR